MLPYLIAGAIGYGIAKLFESEEEVTNKYAHGGSVLLAPNGKPSNLTPEQYKLVRTKAFKDWFGDWENDPANASKVVDSNGEPKVSYHGSSGYYDGTMKGWGTKFTKFSTNRLIFATNNYVVAEHFGDVGKYFVNIKNPFILDGNSFVHAWDRLDETELIKKIGEYDFIQFVNEYFKEDFSNIDEYWQSEYDSEPIKIDIDSFGYYLKKNFNYDGIIAYGIEETPSHIEADDYISFESNQIKLADGTNTTFDGNNPDIRFKDGGSVLLAPNGEPSNLTPEQYKLVRTPAFKEWFGDWENDSANSSKVVDSNGEPLVVYHGTYVENPFYVFDFKKADIGFHFGTYEQAKNRSETKLFFEGHKSIVNSFFLNIKTIFETSDIGEWEYPQRYIDMFVSDGLISESDAKKNGFYRMFQREDNTQIREYLLAKYGEFVGFIYNNKHEGLGKSFIVLNHSQIKLADGTNTTFDGNNPDIRFKNGGKTSIFNSIEKNNDSITFRGDNYLIAQITIEDSFIDTKGFRLPYKYAEIDSIHAPIDESKLFARIEKKGYGSKMLHELIEFCKQNKIPYIGSKSLNEKSYALLYKFEKLGLLEPKEKGLHKRTILWKIK